MRSQSRTRSRRWLLVAAGLTTALLDMGLYVREAQAIIGRPLTPLSFAGVARRTTRRAVVGGVVVGATAAHYW